MRWNLKEAGCGNRLTTGKYLSNVRVEEAKGLCRTTDIPIKEIALRCGYSNTNYFCGFESDSAIEHMAYEGENMAKLGDCVVISVNHRLNVLGYCDLSDFGEEYANSGNAGISDLIMALEWIRDNIEAFGGNPDNVTLFGQSGGGCKITALLQAPAADGLFHKGLIMSGVIDSQVLGRAFRHAQSEQARFGGYIGNSPHPNAFYLRDPLQHGFREETKHIPLMIGIVFGEFSSFAPTKYDKYAMAEEEQTEYLRRELGGETADQLINETTSRNRLTVGRYLWP